MQHDVRKTSKVKKGFLAVQVGLEDDDDQDLQQFYDDDYCKKELQKFVIPICYLYHPLFIGLLDRAREVYGYHADGPLRLPCSVDDFIHLCWVIQKESHPGGGSRRHVHGHDHDDHHHQQHLFNHAPSFRSC